MARGWFKESKRHSEAATRGRKGSATPVERRGGPRAIGNIYWRDALGQKLKIIDRGAWYEAGGKAVFWHGNEGTEAQQALRNEVRRQLPEWQTIDITGPFRKGDQLWYKQTDGDLAFGFYQGARLAPVTRGKDRTSPSGITKGENMLMLWDPHEMGGGMDHPNVFIPVWEVQKAKRPVK